MEDPSPVFTIPRHLQMQAARLRRFALAHVLLEPVAIWVPVLIGVRGTRVGFVGVPLMVALWLLLQIPALRVPRTMRRRYRRMTGQAGLAAGGIFAVQALALAAFGKLTWLVFGTAFFNLPVLFLLWVSLPVYLVARPEDTSRT